MLVDVGEAMISEGIEVSRHLKIHLLAHDLTTYVCGVLIIVARHTSTIVCHSVLLLEGSNTSQRISARCALLNAHGLHNHHERP